MHKRNVFLLLFVIGISLCTFMIWRRHDPFMPYLTITLQKPNEWEIGILSGPDPFADGMHHLDLHMVNDQVDCVC